MTRPDTGAPQQRSGPAGLRSEIQALRAAAVLRAAAALGPFLARKVDALWATWSN